MSRLFSLILTFCWLTSGAIVAQNSPPNFVLIFTDDQGYQDVGFIEAHRADIKESGRPVGQAEGGRQQVSVRWPRWRGPDSCGSTTSGAYAAEWSSTDNLVWKSKLPGIGCSTPIVWGDRIFVTSPAEGKDTVLEFDWSGKPGWKTAVGKDRGGRNRNGSGSNSSPVTDGNSIFAYFRSGNVAGLDLGGKLLWSTNLQERFGKDTLYWDIGTSPVITEKYVVVAVMHSDGSYLVAFEKRSGELAWKVDRNYECPVEGDHSYTTPIVIEEQGREAILVWGAERLTAHDAADGKILWSCAGFNPKARRNWVTVASAVISGDIAVVPYGRGARLAGIRLGGKGDVTATHRLWTANDIGSFVPTPVAYGGKVYVVRDKGEVICVDPKTGNTEWRDRFPKDNSKYYASPVIAGGKLYATREDGVISVARLYGGFKLLAQNDMEERMIACPVPIRNRLLLRGENHLFCVAAP